MTVQSEVGAPQCIGAASADAEVAHLNLQVQLARKSGRAITFNAAQVHALVHAATEKAVAAAAEMHAELLAHLERVPTNAIVLPLQPMTMHLSEWDSIEIRLNSVDETRTVVMYRYYSGAHAGSWLVAEKIWVAGDVPWERSWGGMRPDDFGTLFEVRA